MVTLLSEGSWSWDKELDDLMKTLKSIKIIINI